MVVVEHVAANTVRCCTLLAQDESEFLYSFLKQRHFINYIKKYLSQTTQVHKILLVSLLTHKSICLLPLHLQ
jgi:restriction endonuclease S subunit